MYNQFVFPTTFDKKAKLHTDPHYTDKRFKHEQTIFGAAEDDLHYDYSDRIRDWHYDKTKESAKKASALETPQTCAWYEVYLSACFDKEVEIKHIVAGVNRGNGYPYLVFGYKTK